MNSQNDNPQAFPSSKIREEFNRLKGQLTNTHWTVQEEITFFAFFSHGWHGRVNDAEYQRMEELEAEARAAQPEGER